MLKGNIFDIKEFAINDGPGIRITFFMKGCPLRCLWCHNPEGLSSKKQRNIKSNRIIGQEYTVEEILNKVLKFKDVFELSGGGITFSGGEPTQQFKFIYEVSKRLQGIHKNLDTCGYCNPENFKKLLSVMDLVYYDLKLMNKLEHIKYTEKSNEIILENFKILERSSVPYHIRIPLIPDITDTKENLKSIYDFILKIKRKPKRIDPLPYNILAGGKYPCYDMDYPLSKNKTKNNLTNIKEFIEQIKKLDISVMEN